MPRGAATAAQSREEISVAGAVAFSAAASAATPQLVGAAVSSGAGVCSPGARDGASGELAPLTKLTRCARPLALRVAARPHLLHRHAACCSAGFCSASAPCSTVTAPVSAPCSPAPCCGVHHARRHHLYGHHLYRLPLLAPSWSTPSRQPRMASRDARQASVRLSLVPIPVAYCLCLSVNMLCKHSMQRCMLTVVHVAPAAARWSVLGRPAGRPSAVWLRLYGQYAGGARSSVKNRYFVKTGGEERANAHRVA